MNYNMYPPDTWCISDQNLENLIGYQIVDFYKKIKSQIVIWNDA